MKLELLIDSENFWGRFREDIAAARNAIYIQTLSFEGDSVGRRLSGLLNESHAVDKRVIVDYYTRHILSDKLLYSPRNLFDSELHNEKKETARMIDELREYGTKVKFVNPFGPLLIHIPARNHKKIIIIDDEIAYIGGINFSEHNFAWHDLMLRIRNKDVVDFLKNDFMMSWDRKHFGGRGQFDNIEIFSFDGMENKKSFEPIMRLIDNAHKSIYVQSPYLCFPFSDKLADASGRGIDVTIVSPAQNNKKTLRKYIEWESARSGFDLRMYQNRMTHMKAMLIDDEYLIVGSCNFDCFSYYFEQEIIAVISDADIIGEFKDKVIEIDNFNSIPYDGKANNFSGRLLRWEMQAVNAIAKIFN
ncbi:MAG: phosphatidylserine/phosphatidylglycerophosphate/cardiolipin synthase family protein [Candidatus Zixiibacteriota bacterium]